jgi:hypothetical protein
MSKREGTDQGRHLAALRDRARRPDVKDRSGRGQADRAAIEQELADAEEGDE